MQTNQPLISTIIPTYNRANLVTRAIDSVFNQTYTNHEIIVVDDAGNDDTCDVLTNKYGNKIKYIKKKVNHGLAAARNTGITIANGEYIAFLDDDDTWFPEKLKLQINLMLSNSDLGMVYCGCRQIGPDKQVIQENLPTKKGNIFEDMLQQNWITGSASAVLIKKKLFNVVGLFDEDLTAVEDWDLWIRLSKHTKIDYINRPLIKYNYHGNNMHSDISRMEKNTFSLLDKHWATVTPSLENNKNKGLAYRNRSIKFAWDYYHSGDIVSFERLMFEVLKKNPIEAIFLSAGNLIQKESALIKVFNHYWNQPETKINIKLRNKSFRTQYTEMRWSYHKQKDLINFRHCIYQAIKFSFPAIPLRLILSLLKSFIKQNPFQQVGHKHEQYK